MGQSVTVAAVHHPSTYEFVSGINLEDICEQVEGSPLDYKFRFDPDQKAHKNFFNRCLHRQEIKILEVPTGELARIDPGFGSKETRKIFEDLKETTIGAEKIGRDMEKADLAVSKSLEIERSNLDLGAVDENRKVLRERIAALEDLQVKVETCGRRIKALWQDLFKALDGFQLKRVEAKVQEILPEVEKYNNHQKVGNRHFQKEIAPKLRELHALNPASPPEIYFTHLNLTDLQVRQIKTLEVYPQITLNQDRFESKMEVQPYAKK